jgi:hypothetical protein
MSTEEELKWTTKRYSWRYIPFRYQAMVATIVSALLYFNIFQVFFGRQSSPNNTCGTFFRPILENEKYSDGWFWHSLQDAVSEYDGTSITRCSGTWGALWWEAIASFVALAICGLVLRRAIKRDDATA